MSKAYKVRLLNCYNRNGMNIFYLPKLNKLCMSCLLYFKNYINLKITIPGFSSHYSFSPLSILVHGMQCDYFTHVLYIFTPNLCAMTKK